jgi:hypothetical protein
MNSSDDLLMCDRQCGQPAKFVGKFLILSWHEVNVKTNLYTIPFAVVFKK